MGAFQNLRVYCATALAGQVFILTLGLYLIDKLFFVPKLLDHHKFFPLDKFDIFQAILDKEEIFLQKILLFCARFSNLSRGINLFPLNHTVVLICV